MYLFVGARHLEDRLAGARGRDHLAVDADLHLLGQADPPSCCSALRMSQRRQREVSSMAATGVRPSETSALERTRVGGRPSRRARAARPRSASRGGSIAYSNSGPERREALRAHQALVDVAGRLLAVAHGVRDVRGAGDQVAAGVEALAAGLERVAVHLERARLLRPSGPRPRRSRGRPSRPPRGSRCRTRRGSTSSVGTGRRRPEVSNSPSFVFTASIARTWPSACRPRCGAGRRGRGTCAPSCSAASISSGIAGMSLRSRR